MIPDEYASMITITDRKEKKDSVKMMTQNMGITGACVPPSDREERRVQHISRRKTACIFTINECMKICFEFFRHDKEQLSYFSIGFCYGYHVNISRLIIYHET